MSLKVVFDTSTILTKEYLISSLKTYTGTPPLLPLTKKAYVIAINLFSFSLLQITRSPTSTKLSWPSSLER